MKAEDLWKSHSQCQQYPLKDFKRYNKNMKNLVTAKEMRAAAEDAVSLRGPFEPATHDASVFCRGKKEVPKESWDRNALYFKIEEGD